MEAAPELARLDAVRQLRLLDTDPEPIFDDLCRLAMQAAGTPMAVVTLVDDKRQWFKARFGLQVSETPREIAFCSHAIHSPGPFVVTDAASDPRFRANPLVLGSPHIRFYAGVPLALPQGLVPGTLAVIDRVAREPTAQLLDTLQALGRLAVRELALRREMREMEDNLRHIEEASYAIAHEFSAPLRAIDAQAAMLVEEFNGALPGGACDRLGAVRRSAQDLAGFAGRLLEFARLGRGVLRKKVVDMRSLAMAAAEEAGAAPAACVEEMPPVYGDARLLARVWANLAANAMRHAGGAAVRLGFDAQKQAYFVRDAGPGFDPAHAGTLFTPFGRLEVGGEGGGLGLAVARRVIESHGGRIWAESSPGAGAAFYFTL